MIEYAFRSAGAGGDGLFAVDRRGRVLAANDAAQRRLSFAGLEVPLPIREALEATLKQRALALDREFAVDWQEAPGKIKLLASPVRYGQQPVGALVRVVATGAPSPSRPAAKVQAPPPPPPVSRYEFAQILGESEAIRGAIALARVAVRNDLPVVLFGESGTGKELFAQAIHSASARGDGPFIAVNCGSIPSALVEAELFGYEAGTFTGGRHEGKAGKFEDACGGRCSWTR